MPHNPAVAADCGKARPLNHGPLGGYAVARMTPRMGAMVHGVELKRAHALYLQGRFNDAKAAYLQIVASDSGNAAVLERLGEIALWENQCSQAQHLFEQALHDRPWHSRFWPLDAQLKYRLALTHYRRDSFATAARWFRQAAGPFPIGPLRELKALEQQAALFDTDATYAVEGPEETTVPFVVTDPLPVIEAYVNGQGPFNLFIDTGGAELILDPEVAGRVGAQLSGALRGDYAGQRVADTGLGKIDAVKLGDIVVRNLPIHTLDTNTMSTVFDGREIHGALGTRVLMHFSSTLDYINGALTLRRPESAGAQALAGAPGASVIPFWLVEMHCIATWGTLNDQAPMLFWVDTGLANAGFSATDAVLGRAGIHIDWSRAETGIGGAGQVKQVDFVVDRLALGTGTDAVVETNVRGVAIDGSVSVLQGKLGMHISGMISHEFFRRRVLTLDFQKMRLMLQ